MPNNDLPLFFELPLDQQPDVTRRAESEEFLLHSINTGRGVICAHQHLGSFYGVRQVIDHQTPDWREPETYYDAITDILEAADHVGHDVESLCSTAISNQRAFKDQAQQDARTSRGENG